MAENIKFTRSSGNPDLVELRNISQTYDGGKTMVIDGLNLLLEDGKNNFISILGASGCGKSTILSYISGLRKPSSGEVLINGKPITKDTVVGMVFQKYSSFPWLSVLENVALGLEIRGVPEKERNDKAMEMIQRVGLDGHQDKYAQSPSLSGGQLQRVAIARSLLANPKILLMDEPFGALDINTRADMQDMLNDIMTTIPDMSIIFITHDISEAVYLTDDVYFMQSNPGRIIDSFHVDLPFERERSLKRTPKFKSMVDEVEERMEAMVPKKAVRIKKGGVVEAVK
jgi:NitT/TauT family transport system ATP-binding protein